MLAKIKSLVYKALNHEGFMRYAKNTSWLMGEKMLRMVVGLLVGIWVARYLGPEQFGLFSYAQSFVFLFTAFATLGLDNIIIRELVKDSSQQDALLGTAFALKLIGAIIILPFLWIAFQFTNNDGYTNQIIFIIASATIFQSFNVIDYYYQSVVMSKYVAMANSIALCLSSLIKVVMILNKAPLMAFVCMAVFDSVVLAIGLVYFYLVKTKNKLTSWKFDFNWSKVLLKHSFPIMIASVMFVTYSKIDQIFIQHYLGNEEVGYYAASLRLVDALSAFPVLLISSLFPAIVNAKQTSEIQYKQRLKNLVKLCLAGTIIIALIIDILAPMLIHLLYGNSFESSIGILRYQVWLMVLTTIGYINGYWMLAENMEWQTFYNYGSAAVLNIVLNYIMIPKFGTIGAVYASVVSLFFAYYVVLWFSKRTRFLVKNIYWL